MQKFAVENVKCENCAKLIKNALRNEFGEVEVDLNAQPRVLSLNVDETKISALKNALDELNFGIIKEI